MQVLTDLTGEEAGAEYGVMMSGGQAERQQPAAERQQTTGTASDTTGTASDDSDERVGRRQDIREGITGSRTREGITGSRTRTERHNAEDAGDIDTGGVGVKVGAEEEAKRKLEDKAMKEAEEKARIEVEEKAKKQGEKKVRKEAEEKAEREEEDAKRIAAEVRAKAAEEVKAKATLQAGLVEEQARTAVEERAMLSPRKAEVRPEVDDEYSMGTNRADESDDSVGDDYADDGFEENE
jgi:hypothetical protein